MLLFVYLFVYLFIYYRDGCGRAEDKVRLAQGDLLLSSLRDQIAARDEEAQEQEAKMQRMKTVIGSII